MAETKVRRAGADNCFANGERRALENVREAMLYFMEWRGWGREEGFVLGGL
jgi:hypothetical protein